MVGKDVHGGREWWRSACYVHEENEQKKSVEGHLLWPAKEGGSRAVNEPSFVEEWMFKLSSTAKVECSSLTWVWYEPINNVQAWACYKV